MCCAVEAKEYGAECDTEGPRLWKGEPDCWEVMAENTQEEAAAVRGQAFPIREALCALFPEDQTSWGPSSHVGLGCPETATCKRPTLFID